MRCSQIRPFLRFLLTHHLLFLKHIYRFSNLAVYVNAVWVYLRQYGVWTIRDLTNSHQGRFATFFINSRLSFWTIRDFALNDSWLCYGRFATFTLVNSCFLFPKSIKLRLIRAKERNCVFIARIFFNEKKSGYVLNFQFEIEFWHISPRLISNKY